MKPVTHRAKATIANRIVTPYYHRKRKFGPLLCEDLVEKLTSFDSKLRRNMGRLPEDCFDHIKHTREFDSDQYIGHLTPDELAWLAKHPNYKPEWMMWLIPSELDTLIREHDDDSNPKVVNWCRNLMPKKLGGMPHWYIKAELQRRHVELTGERNDFYETSEEVERTSGLTIPDAAMQAVYTDGLDSIDTIEEVDTKYLCKELLIRWRTNFAVGYRNDWVVLSKRWMTMAQTNRSEAISKLTIGEMRAELFRRGEELDDQFSTSVEVHQALGWGADLSEHMALTAIAGSDWDEVMKEWEPDRILKERVWRTYRDGELTQLGRDWNMESKSCRKMLEEDTVAIHRLTTEDIEAELIKRQKDNPVQRCPETDMGAIWREVKQDREPLPRTLFWPLRQEQQQKPPFDMEKVISKLVKQAKNVFFMEADYQWRLRRLRKEEALYVDYRTEEFTEARVKKGELCLNEPFEYTYTRDGYEGSDDEETEEDSDLEEYESLHVDKMDTGRAEIPGRSLECANHNRAMLAACAQEEVYVSGYPPKCRGCKCDIRDKVCEFIDMTLHMTFPVVMPKDEIVRYFQRTMVGGIGQREGHKQQYWAIPECIMKGIEANFVLEEDLVEVNRASKASDQ